MCVGKFMHDSEKRLRVARIRALPSALGDRNAPLVSIVVSSGVGHQRIGNYATVYDQAAVLRGIDEIGAGKANVARNAEALAERLGFCLKILFRTQNHTQFSNDYEHPVVFPHVSHLRHVPFLTSVKFPHSPQESPW